MATPRLPRGSLPRLHPSQGPRALRRLSVGPLPRHGPVAAAAAAAAGQRRGYRSRYHFGEYWWSDWLNNFRVWLYRRENPGVWDIKMVGSDKTVDEVDDPKPGWRVRARRRLEVLLGLRRKTIRDTPHDERQGIYTPHLLARNRHQEDVPCVQFSDCFDNHAVPAVIILHDRWGVTPDVLEMGRFLKLHGFHAVIPELYRGKRPFSHLDAAAMAQSLDVQLAIDDVEGVIDVLRLRNPYRTVGCLGIGSMGSEVALAAHSEFEKPDGNFDGCVVVGCGVVPGARGSLPWRTSRMLYPLQCHFSGRDSLFTSAGTERERSEKAKLLVERRERFRRYLHHMKCKDHQMYEYPNVDYGFMQPGDWYNEVRGALGLSPQCTPTARLAWDRILSFFRRTLRPFDDIRRTEDFEQRQRDEYELTVRNLEYQGDIPRIPFVPPKMHPLEHTDCDFRRYSKDEFKRIVANQHLSRLDTSIDKKRKFRIDAGDQSAMENIFQMVKYKGYRLKRYMKRFRIKEVERAYKANSTKLMKTRKMWWLTEERVNEAYGYHPKDRTSFYITPEWVDTDLVEREREQLSPSERRLPNRKVLFGDGVPHFTPKKPSLEDIQERRHRINSSRPPEPAPSRKLPPPPGSCRGSQKT